MNKTIKALLALQVLFLLSSCASIKISSDYDKSVRFSAFGTYEFTNETLNLPVDDTGKQWLLTAVGNELAAKGFTKAEKPDVLIDIKIKTRQIHTATASNSVGDGDRYRWGADFSTARVNYEQYKQGTVFVDMIDASTNTLVWEGRATGTFDSDANPARKEEKIKYGTKQMFMNYPPEK